MPLNDRQIKNAKPKEKDYKLTDGKGLYLLITPAGGKLWRLKYRIAGKEKTLAIGKYPQISLAQAREAAIKAKCDIAQGSDPNSLKQQAKAQSANSLQAIALQWHAQNIPRWKPNHAHRVLTYLQTDVFPHLGSMDIRTISVQDVKTTLERVTSPNVAEKIRQWLGAIYRYAAMLEITDRNPAGVLQGVIHRPPVKHMPALPAAELETFYSRLKAAHIAHSNRIAIMLLMLTFTRSNELRGAQWQEMDFQAAIWHIPAHRMKMNRPHAVPLADWTLELLHELQAITGSSPFLFPSRTKLDSYISENTLGKIIHNMGYKGIATPHGFRSLASSTLNEQGFNPAAIERQLAHEQENAVAKAYNRADYWQERVRFMQWYCDYLKAKYQAINTSPLVF